MKPSSIGRTLLKNGGVLFLSAFLSIIFLYISGADFRRIYYPSHDLYYYRTQVECLLNGSFALSPHIEAMQFDLAWYDGGVQQLWGLGAPLWMLPFRWVCAIGGYACSDALPLFTALGLLSFYTMKTSLLLLDKRQSLTDALLFSGMIFFFPSLWIFFWGPKGVYEVACLYALIFSLMLLVATIRYVVDRKNFDFFLACFLAGFVANVRPTHGVYGVAAGCICLWIASECWRQSQRFKELWKCGAGALLILGGFLFLAWSNGVRFGHLFEFGHNLSFSGDPIVYLTRFGNPCEEASVWTLVRELFFWLFTLPYGHSLLVEIPRWRDIYQPTFGVSYLLLLILTCVFLIRFSRVCGRVRRMNLSDSPSCPKVSWRADLVKYLCLWFLLSFGVLFLFYLKFATLSTRYFHDFAPAFLAATYCLLFSCYGRKVKLVIHLLLCIFICWKIGLIMVSPLSTTAWFFRAPDSKQLSLPEGQKISEFSGQYSLESFPGMTGISGNGMGWDKKTGTVKSIALFMVDHPQFLELIMGPEEEGAPEVFRAKINNVELPLESITPTSVGTNQAQCVRFSIPEAILRQNNDQMVSLCFSPSFHERDMSRTRPLYQVKWR